MIEYALTLWQPYATMMMLGIKTIETRCWPTNHRGRLWIHAAKTWNPDLAAICKEHPFCDHLPAAMHLPRGYILGHVNVTDMIESVKCRNLLIKADNWNELACGDYRAGRWGWITRDLYVLEDPIPCKGGQRLWHVPAGLLPGPSELMSIPTPTHGATTPNAGR